jgi:hypothetical protein
MYALIRTEIDNQLEWLARMKNNELLPAPATGTGGGRSGVSDRMANAINRRLDLEARVLPQIEAGLAELEAIEAAIDALDNPLEREVLRLRYTQTDCCRPMAWGDISGRIYGDDDEAHVKATLRLHGRALQSIQQTAT